jgi:hypothetical protein
MSQDAIERAIALSQQGDADGAKPLLARALKADPHNVNAWLWLGYNMRTDEERIRVLETCLHFNPDSVEARKRLDEINARRQNAQKPPQPVQASDAAPSNQSSRPKREPAMTADSRAALEPKKATSTTTGRTMVQLGALGLVIGALLPWAHITAAFVGKVSKAGYEGDGAFTGGIGLLILIGALVSKGKVGKPYSVASAVFSVIAGLILLVDLAQVGSIGADLEFAVVQTGVGIYLSLVGAFLAFLGGLRRVPVE